MAQDTWLKALQADSRFGHPHPEAWLMRIARNLWIDRARRMKVLQRIMDAMKPEPAALPDSGLLELEPVMWALVRHLPTVQRTVFLLRDMLGYSIRETAGLLKTTEGAVKAAHHRARLSLEAIREELAAGELPVPQEEGQKAFLRAITAAYGQGDTDGLVRLVESDVLEPVVAIAAVQGKRLRLERQKRSFGSPPGMRLAA